MQEGQVRLIHFADEISAESIDHLVTQLRSANAPKAVMVNSPGGTFEFFSRVAPAIERRGIVTLSGEVASAAVILYLLGQRRLALPDATFFFHEVRTIVRPGNEITLTTLEEFEEQFMRLEGENREMADEFARHLRSSQTWLMNYVAERMGVRPHVIQDLMRREETLDARDAVRYGLAHQIITPHRD